MELKAARDVLAGLVIPDLYGEDHPGRAEALLGSANPDDWLALLAEVGGYQSDGDGTAAWTRWLALQTRLGRNLDAALDTLGEDGLRDLALFGLLGEGPEEVGIASYHRFVEVPAKKYPPHRGHATEYLLALFSRGDDDAVRREHRLLHAELGRTPELDIVLLAAEARYGSAEARVTLEKRAHDIDRPHDQQALAAYLAHEIKPARAWGELIARVLGEKTIWKVFRARFSRLPERYGIPLPTGAKDEPPPRNQAPGSPLYVVEPGEGAAVAFGPERWKVPPCAGCGHPTFVWYELHPAEILELAKWLPWKVFPFLACADCGFWMGVNRYEIAVDKKEITLLEAELAGDKKLAEPFSTTEAPKPAGASLKKVTAGAWKKIFAKDEPTVVAGKPPRLADHTWPRCRACRRWMQYAGGLGTDRGFAKMPPMANDAGYLLHFACVDCARITVVPNWS